MGRPRMRRLDDDIRTLRVRGWRRCALDRDGWRTVVEQVRGPLRPVLPVGKVDIGL